MSRKKKAVNYAKWGYIFVLPFTIAFLIFQLYPIIYTLVVGFTDLKGIGNTTINFLQSDPFRNFKMILGAKTFHQALGNTFVIWIANFVPQMLLALLLAEWFTNRRSKIKGQGVFKVLFYMPNIITAATIGVLFNALFGYPMGPINDLLQRIGLIKEPLYFLNDRTTARNIVIFIQTWMWYGYTMINLISGILGISPEIYEGAEVDGATRWQTFWKITIPNIRTILLFTLVTSLIGGLTMFDIPKVFLNGQPDNATLTASVFIYNQAFAGSYMFNRAAAASMIMFAIVLFFSLILFFLMRDKDEIKMHKIIKAQEKAYKKQLKEERLKGGAA